MNNPFEHAVLRSSPASPYARKVRMAMEILGLSQHIRIENANTQDPDDSVRQQNPLGKIPVLILSSGEAFFDSKVIVELLASVQSPPRWFAGDVWAQARERTRLNLCDGVTDATLLMVYEGRYREANQASPRWLDLQAGKVRRGLASLEQSPPPPDVTESIAAMALVCALGYLDFRQPVSWRAEHPGLVAWYEQALASHPCVASTAPV